MHILVLEDAKSIQRLVAARLEKAGHTVDAVDNGQQGFRLATAQSYDVIISDIRMPLWDGMKFVEAMQVICPHLPIIIVTTDHDQPEVIQRLDKCVNVKAVLPKPHNFETLFQLLSTIRPQSQTAVSKMSRIICTIGPASSDEETLGRMIIAGMDVVRLNFSHGSYEQHEQSLLAVREAERRWDRPIAVLQDLCGPKIRVGKMADGGARLEAGAEIIIQKEEITGSSTRISTIAPEIIADLKEGDPVLLDDGLLELRVTSAGENEAHCQVVTGGLLKSGKGMNLPATQLSMPSVTEKDWKDLEWGLNNSVDYVALSFVRTAEEILEIKEHIAKAGNTRIKVIAKIEKPEAVNNIRSIIEATDGIMIARGDMGVELPAARVPGIQRKIIQQCWAMNTPVITATQMLDSMTINPRPTRAEVTDVSTAIEGGTDAVMLSQETAVGVDPVNVVRTMASISFEAEHASGQQFPVTSPEQDPGSFLSTVSRLQDIKAVMLLDPGGTLFPLLSKWNRRVVNIMVTQSQAIARRASLFKNITPLIIDEQLHRTEIIRRATARAIEMGCLCSGDRVAVVEGPHLTKEGIEQDGAIQVVKVKDETTSLQ